jgi:hypothetical protein
LDGQTVRRDKVPLDRIAIGSAHQHANTPHPLLRPPRNWPRRRRATEKRDEGAAVH